MALLCLYDNILISILSDWISDEDLCYLDCAFCNSNLRNLFLSTMSKCWLNSVLLYRHVKTNEIERISWLTMRQLTVKRIEMRAKTDLRLKLASHLNFLCIYLNLSNILEFSTAQSISVNALKVVLCGVNDWKLIKPVLCVFQNVRHLDINVGGDSVELSSFLVSLYPNLIGMKFFGNFGQVVDLINGCPDLLLLENIRSDEFLGIRGQCSLRRIEQPCSTSVLIAGKHFEVIGVYVTQIENESSRFLANADYIKVFCFDMVMPVILSGNLIEFCVYGVKNSELLSHVFRQCPRLRIVSLAACTLSDECMTVLVESCQAVEKIELDGSTLSESSIISVWNKCPLLSTFSTKKIRTIDNVIAVVAGERLDSFVFDVSKPQTISMKRDCDRKLKRFSCYDPIKTTSLESILKNNPGLVKISLNFQTVTGDDLIANLVRLCPLLTSVSISLGVVENALRSLSKLTLLTSCSIDGLKIVRRGDFHSLLLNKPHFRKLSIPKTKIEDDLSVIGILCPRITFVDFSDCANITNRDVVALLEGCKSLEALNISWCSMVTREILESLASLRMRYLNILGCKIDKTDIAAATTSGFTVVHLEALDSIAEKALD